MLTAYLALCSLLADVGGPAAGSTSITVSESRPVELFSGADRLDASVRTEMRAGEAPLLAGLPPEAFAAEVLTARVQLQLRSPATIWTSWYGPRLLWQEPHTPSSSEVLVLHEFGSSLDTRLSRTTEVTGAVDGSVGQHDYTSVQQALGTVQGTLPPASDMAAVTAQAGLAVRLSRRWALGLGAEGFYWRWLQLPADTPPSTVTSSLSASGGPSVTFRATERDAFGFDLPVSDVRYSTGAEQVAVTSAARWTRALAHRVDLRLRLGLSYARATFSPPVAGAPATESTVSPIGSAEVASRGFRWNDVMFVSRGSAGVDYYLDPVLAVGVRRWTAGGGVDAISSPDWTLGLRGDFATVFGEVAVQAGQPEPDETAFSVMLSVRKRLSGHLFAELTGQWADRGPSLGTPDFHFHQRQLWVSLTIGATTLPAPR